MTSSDSKTTTFSPQPQQLSAAQKGDFGALRQLWKSPWTGWVGFRYLKSKKNSRFLSLITLVSILGVALGVTAMVVVLSVMDGFEAELKKRLMSTDLHVLISPTREVQGFDAGFVPKTSLDEKSLIRAVDAENEILEFWPIVSTEAILKTGRKVAGVALKGIPRERMEKFRSHVTESVDSRQWTQEEGSNQIRSPGVLIGQELAYELGTIPGDMITLVSPTEMEGPGGNIPRLKRFMVEGIYRTGLPEQELHTVFALDQAVRSFLKKKDGVSQWEIALKDFDQAPEISPLLKRELPQFRVQDWSQLNAHLFQSLRLERIAMFVILAFIIIVASFNIVTTLTLMVLERKREISILKAMGARHSQVAAIFLAEGVFIGALGVGGGILMGGLICSILKRYEFITLPDIYYDRTLPVTFDPLYYVLVAICALSIVLAACIYPSRRAARLNPLDGIRFG